MEEPLNPPKAKPGPFDDKTAIVDGGTSKPENEGGNDDEACEDEGCEHYIADIDQLPARLIRKKS